MEFPRWTHLPSSHEAIQPLLIAGGIVFALGLLVSAGWLTGSFLFVMPHPALPAMVLNSALLFVLIGLGLLLYVRDYPRSTLAIGAAVFLAGLLTLVEYLFGIDLWIDLVPDNGGLSGTLVNPGRMALSSSVAFQACGLALTLLGSPWHPHWRHAALGVLGAVLLAIVVDTLISFLGDSPSPYQWGGQQGIGMAPHSAGAFLALGIGLAGYAWINDRMPDSALPRWMPVLVGMVVMAGSVALSLAQYGREWGHIDNRLKAEASSAAHAIRTHITNDVLSIERMARRAAMHDGIPRAEWEDDARQYLHHFAAAENIAWLGPGWQVRWAVGPDRVDPDRAAATRRYRSLGNELVRLRERRTSMVVWTPEDADRLHLCAPVFQRAGFDGAICGSFDTARLFAGILHAGVARGFDLRVIEGLREIFRRGEPGADGPSAAQVDIGGEFGSEWRVQVSVAPAALAAIRSRMPELTFAVGTTLALLLTLLAHLAMRYGHRARELDTVNHSLYAEMRARARAETLNTRLGRLLDDSPCEIYLFDADTLRITYANRGLLGNLGYTLEELRGRTPLDFLPEFTPESFSRQLESLRTGHAYQATCVTLHRRRNGSPYPVETRLQMRRQEEPPVYMAMAEDISQRRDQELERRKLARAVEQTDDAVFITNLDGVIEFVNPAFERVTGYRREEAIGRTPAILRSGRQPAEFYEQMWRTLLAGETFREVFVNRRKDGSLYYEQKSITPLKDEQAHITHFISTGRDVTAQLDVHDRLQHLIRHDVVTQLPTRTVFAERVAQALQRGAPFAVMSIGVDNFAPLVESRGRDASDRLLVQFSRRLREALASTDTAARLDDERFAVLVEDARAPSDLSALARKLHATLSVPYLIDDRVTRATFSIGIACYPADGADSSALLSNADVARNDARDSGRHEIRFFSDGMNRRHERHMALEAELRRALDDREYLLNFQPLLDLRAGELCALEALLRWKHPERGLILPEEFLPVLVDTGLIKPVGAFVLRAVCEQTHAWQATGLTTVPVAINVSARDLMDADYTDTVTAMLEETGIEEGLLQLEVDDAILATATSSSLEKIQTIVRRGVRLVVDDFDIGNSSLRRLAELQASAVKIHDARLRCLADGDEEEAVVQALFEVAHKLGLEVIAERVETPEEWRRLEAAGCDVLQGNVYHRPLTAIEITRLLKKTYPQKNGL
jgi:PAS domain S-box-containing protein/diguanylate cyclase (GGDEF)-like protein